MSLRRAVLMGDPRFFRIKGGANPHTRTRWGFRKEVDRPLAARQWNDLARALAGLDVDVHVVPPEEDLPGMVFPANAGFMTEEGVFVLSTALPTRARERDVYASFLAGLGVPTVDVPFRFEGEADLFPAGDVYLFTSGPLERQRFVPRLGWPPYRRVYGFRSDGSALESLKAYCGKPVIPLTLVRETHYHGDTCLCSFGAGRRFLMAYLPALDDASRSRLKEAFGERLLPLSEEDGASFSANSFHVGGPESVLLMPVTASGRLRAQVEERGSRVVTADVSEFMTKGGGSVKCMIGDLGLLAARRSDFPFKQD